MQNTDCFVPSTKLKWNDEICNNFPVQFSLERQQNKHIPTHNHVYTSWTMRWKFATFTFRSYMPLRVCMKRPLRSKYPTKNCTSDYTFFATLWRVHFDVVSETAITSLQNSPPWVNYEWTAEYQAHAHGRLGRKTARRVTGETGGY